VPDGRARVRPSPPSPGQSAAGLGLTARSSAFAIFAARTGARFFVGRQAFGSAGRQGLGVDKARPTHRRRIQIRNLCQRMSRVPPSSAPCVGRTSGSKDSEGLWRPPVVIILLLGGPTCPLRSMTHRLGGQTQPEVGLRFLDDYFCLTSCFAARAAASM
jgi:hypothetical protein